MNLNKWKLAFKKIFNKEVLVIGDSHVQIFSNEDLTDQFSGYYFNICSVGGATVSGLVNPNSITQALPNFRRALNKSRAETTIVNLGEVDTGFLIWFRAQKKECKVQDMLDVALANYQEFLDEIAIKTKIICISAPLPTIKDDQYWGDVANLRKEVKATQLERTDLTIDFNRKMELFCEERQYNYLNLDDIALEGGRVVNEKFIHRDRTDHHYNPKFYSKIISEELEKLLIC